MYEKLKVSSLQPSLGRHQGRPDGTEKDHQGEPTKRIGHNTTQGYICIIIYPKKSYFLPPPPPLSKMMGDIRFCRNSSPY